MKVLGLVLVLSLSVVLATLYWQSREWDSQSMPEAYRVLDDLEEKGIYQSDQIVFESLEGKKIPLISLKGKVVILSFWATWCEPCVDEFPSFIKLLDEYPEKVVLVAISQDNEEKDVKKFIEAFNGYRQNMIVTMDKDKNLGRVFAVDRLPEGFVFNQDGKLIKKIIGIQNWASEDALKFFQQL